MCCLYSVLLYIVNNIYQTTKPALFAPQNALSLQVFSRKRATNYRALWREITNKDKASLGCSPHCYPIDRMPYKLQFIFRSKVTNYRALLQEMTYKDKASNGCPCPCSSIDRPIQLILECFVFAGQFPQKSHQLQGLVYGK